MNKQRNYWPLLFIGIFVFTLYMIIWTIVSAVNTPVHEDKVFLRSYHNLDANFNKMMTSNKDFLKKYEFSIEINKKQFPLISEDIFYSQRVLEKYSKHKNLLKKGKNTVVIKVINKADNQLIKSFVNFKITKATNSTSDISFIGLNTKIFTTDVLIPIEGNWNITGTAKLNDSDIGYFYIKTNAI